MIEPDIDGRHSAAKLLKSISCDAACLDSGAANPHERMDDLPVEIRSN
jgi:hypothetical protein